MSRADRAAQIINFLSTRQWSITMLELGQGVGLKKTKYLEELVDPLVKKGQVLMEWADHPKYGRTRYFWINREYTDDE